MLVDLLKMVAEHDVFRAGLSNVLEHDVEGFVTALLPGPLLTADRPGRVAVGREGDRLTLRGEIRLRGIGVSEAGGFAGRDLHGGDPTVGGCRDQGRGSPGSGRRTLPFSRCNLRVHPKRWNASGCRGLYDGGWRAPDGGD